MSLVRKLQPGGSVDNTALNEALANELANFNLKSKDERKVRDALVKLRDYVGTDGNKFSIDALANKYTISGQGSEKFEGSHDEIKSNWLTGKLKINDDQDAMSVAAAIFGSAYKNVQGSSPVSNTKEKLGIGDLNNYIVDNVYGTPEAFSNDFLNGIKDDEGRKKKVMEYANKHITNYLTQAEKNKDLADYTDIEKAKSIQSAIATGDWDTFKNASYQVKWNPTDFLLTPAQKEAVVAEEKQKKEEVAKQTAETERVAAKSNLTSLGFSPDLAERITLAGLKLGTLKLPKEFNSNISTFASDYLKNKNAFVFDDANGGQSIYTPEGELFNETGEGFDQFNPLSGLAWIHDPTTNRLTFTKSAYKLPDFGDEGVEIKGTIPGFEGWSITGLPDVTNEGKDYTKYLTLTSPDGKIKSKIYKGEDGNYYSDNGQIYSGINFTAFGEPIKNSSTNPIDRFSKHYELNTKLPLNYNYLKDYASLKAALNTTYSKKDKPIVERLVSALSNDLRLKRNKNHYDDIINLINKYTDLINPVKESSKPLESSSPNVRMRKIGGILSAQKGQKFKEYEERMKVLRNSNQTPSISKSSKVPINITGTWADQDVVDNTLDAAALTGTAASFVPGLIGIGGASTVFGAELAKDLRDGHIDNPWSHGINLGFIALSAIGLGGLKTLIKGVKVAKESLTVAEGAAKASKYAKQLAFTEQETNALQKVVKLADKVGAKTPEQLVSKIAEIKKLNLVGNQAKKLTKDVTVFEEGLKVLNKTIESPTLFQSSLPGKAFNKLINVSTQIGKTTSTALKVAGLGVGAYSATKVIPKVLSGDIEYTNPQDVINMVMAASIGKSWLRNKGLAKIIDRQGIKGVAGENKTTFQLGDSDITINKTIEKPILKSESRSIKPNSWLGKNKRIENNKIQLENYKKDIISSATPEQKKIIEDNKELFDKLTLDKFISQRELPTGNYTLGGVQSTNKGRIKDIKDYNKLKKYYDKWGSKSNSDQETMKQIRELTKEEKSQIKTLSKEIPLIEKTSAKYKRPNKIVDRTLNKKKKILRELDDIIDYNKLHNSIFSNKKGGILKAQDGLVMPKGNPGYVNTLSTSGLDYLTGLKLKSKKLFSVLQQPRTFGKYYGGVTNELIARNWKPDILKGAGLDPTKVSQWTIDTPDILQKYIKTRPELYSQLVPEKNSSKDLFGMNWYTIGLNPEEGKIPRMPALKTIPQVFNHTVKPVENSTMKPVENSGQIPSVPKQKNKFDWTSLLNGVPNALMYMNTVAANRDIGNAQRNAVSAGLYQLPYMPHTYLRVDRPNTLFADKQAASVRSSAGRLAGNVSDIDKANAIRLQGEGQAADIETKGQQADLQRFDQLRGQQTENRSKIDQYNTSVLGKNRGMAADAFSKIHLINANQILAQNTAANNFITAADRDFKVGQYKANMNKYWNMANDPKLKTQRDLYLKEAGEEGQAAARKQYDDFVELAKKSGASYAKTFEESKYHTDWQTRIKNAEKALNLVMDPVRQYQSKLQFDQSTAFLKKGGTTGLSKQDHIDIENAKYNNTRKLKDTEMAFKAIIHNNEMLQRALIKVFK